LKNQSDFKLIYRKKDPKKQIQKVPGLREYNTKYKKFQENNRQEKEKNPNNKQTKDQFFL